MINPVEARAKMRQTLISNIDEGLKQNLCFTLSVKKPNKEAGMVLEEIVSDYERLGWTTFFQDDNKMIDLYIGADNEFMGDFSPDTVRGYKKTRV